MAQHGVTDEQKQAPRDTQRSAAEDWSGGTRTMSGITELFPGVEAVAVFIAATIGALAVRHLALWALGRSGCEQSFMYIICRSIKWPSLLLCVLIGAYSTIYLGLAHLSARSNAFALKILHAMLILVATLVVARLAQLSTEYL